MRDSEALHEAEKVIGSAGEVEAEQVCAKESIDDLRAPGQPQEQLDGRERNVEKETDSQVGSELTQHSGYGLLVRLAWKFLMSRLKDSLATSKTAHPKLFLGGGGPRVAPAVAAAVAAAV